MNDRPPMLIREDLYAKVSRRKGFDYDTLRQAIDKGATVLARLNLPERPIPPASMARSVQELEHASNG